jgi:hypothetical protein
MLRELRRVQPSWKRGIANLEHIPQSMIGQEKHPLYGFARMNWGRYYVNRKQKREKSAATGVWDTIWNQIPERVTAQPAMKPNTGATAMANRPANLDAKPFAYPRVPLTKR